MFPEKIEILNGQPRTARLNSVFDIILLKNSEIKDKKRDKIEFVPPSGVGGNRTRVQKRN